MATTAISIEEYLRTVPDPDVEYVDGELKERPMTFNEHGLLQSEICTWFNNHRQEWNVRAGVEGRTQVAPSRVRLPDVIVDRARKWPQVFTQAPMIVIEIMSPSDSFIELEIKCDEYGEMGVQNIWVIDPVRRTGRVRSSGKWTEVKRFSAQGTDIYLDVDSLFETMDSFEDGPENGPEDDPA